MRRLSALALLGLGACRTPPEAIAPDWHGGAEKRAAIVDLIRPPRGGGPITGPAPLPQFDKPSWPFFSQLPESVAFPPDNDKYYSLPVDGTISYREPTGSVVSIIDAYGWIRPESPACTGDPDWHFSFEIDPARTSIDLNQLYKVGNAIHMGRSASGADQPNQSYRRLSTTPRVHVEVTGWRKSDHGGVDPSAWGWVHSTPDCEGGGVLWAFDPNQPEGKPITDGAYVRITGLLITDGFHVCDSWGSGQLPLAPYQKHGKDPNCDSGELQDVKAMWANCHNNQNCTHRENQADNLARWTEIHSPDGIWLEDEQKPQTEVVRQIVLSADHGFFSGMTERIEDDIWPCPADPSHPCGNLPQGKAVGYVQMIDPVTNYRTITDGKCDARGCLPKVDQYADHIHVMAQVHGEGMDGAPGKLKATYRVFVCDCGCDGMCSVPGSTARVSCKAPVPCASGSQCKVGACVACSDADRTANCGNHCNRGDGCGGQCSCAPTSLCIPAPMIGGTCASCGCTPCGRSAIRCNTCPNTCPASAHDCAADGSCTCAPKCSGKCNGEPDGCGGACPTCPSGATCESGACVRPSGCSPPCEDPKTCRAGKCVDRPRCPAGMRDCGDGACVPPHAECP
jgi:hypothetical protein